MPAIKTVAAKPAAVESAAAKTSAKAVGLGRTNANRGGERDSNYRNGHQELAGHVTFLSRSASDFVIGYLSCQKEMPGLLEYGAAFAGLEP
jgi:hypothetical protein